MEWPAARLVLVLVLVTLLTLWSSAVAVASPPAVASAAPVRVGVVLDLTSMGSITFPNSQTGRRYMRKLGTKKSSKGCGGKRLKIAVPHKPGFQVFVAVTDPNSKKQHVTGYSIDIFEAAMTNLHPRLCYKYVAFGGTYDELVYDGAVGDVTITAERVTTTDFTMPYTQSVLVLVQSYAASLSSILTTKSLRPFLYFGSGDFVGYQDGSFVRSLLLNQSFSENRLRSYRTKEQYADALRKGSKNGGVSAIVDEIPYLTSFLSDGRYENDFMMLGSVYETPGFGFAFPLGSSLVHNISIAILDLESGGEGSRIKRNWFGTDSVPLTFESFSSLMDASKVPNTESKPLTVQCFSGLFVIIGSISTLMLPISIMRLIYAKCTELRKADVKSDSVTDDESRLLQNGIGDNPSPGLQPFHVAGIENSGGVQLSGENVGDVEPDTVQQNGMHGDSVPAGHIQIEMHNV
uniref:Glutamate receptor 2.1 n=1 Tax=Aegilops tauschii TaxID=37682 RepID=M8C3B1_AEGTA